MYPSSQVPLLAACVLDFVLQFGAAHVGSHSSLFPGQGLFGPVM